MYFNLILFVANKIRPLSSQGSNIFPVGTILPYIGDLSKIPHGWALCDGKNGTPNLLDGKFLEGTYSIKSVYLPGLPNITGSFGTAVEENGNSFTGAFFANGSGPGGSDGWSDLRVGFIMHLGVMQFMAIAILFNHMLMVFII